MSSLVRVLLADDHAVLRSGLRLLLTNQNQYEVVGEASSGAETLDLAVQLQPDLILLDLSMPALGGLDALPTLRKLVPSARILILTMHDDPQYLRQALKHGASGYVLKKAADAELLSAMRSVLRGELYVQPSMPWILLEEMLPNSQGSNTENAWSSLSDREQEVLKMVALGHTSAEIADQLSLSAKTVETYRARGMEKLELRSRAALSRIPRFIDEKVLCHWSFRRELKSPIIRRAGFAVGLLNIYLGDAGIVPYHLQAAVSE